MKNGNLLDSIYLNKENVQDAYSKVGRVCIKKTNSDLVQLLESNSFAQSWIECYKADMIHYLINRHKPSSLFPAEFAKDILKVLHAIDDSQENLKRALSVKCFGDSKYFERNIEHIITRIIKRYLLDEEALDDYASDDILLQVRYRKISGNNGILW